MKQHHQHVRRPYGGGDFSLRRGGQGTYWQAGHGVVVRVAAAEHGRDSHARSRPGEASPLDDWRGVTAG